MGGVAKIVREREFISQINGGLPDKAFAHRQKKSKEEQHCIHSTDITGQHCEYHDYRTQLADRRRVAKFIMFYKIHLVAIDIPLTPELYLQPTENMLAYTIPSACRDYHLTDCLLQSSADRLSPSPFPTLGFWENLTPCNGSNIQIEVL